MSRVPSRLMASLDLILSSSLCNECEFFGLGSDEGVCVFLLFLCVSSLVLALCGTV